MTHKRLYLSTALLFALNINNHRCKILVHNKCSAVTWRTVLEHIVADTFRSNRTNRINFGIILGKSFSNHFWFNNILVKIRKWKRENNDMFCVFHT